MQLLYSRATPCPEFLSVSLILKTEVSKDSLSLPLREPFLLPSLGCTMPQTTSVQAVEELQHYLLSVLKSTKSTKEKSASKFSLSLLQEDERMLGDMQVFRPCKGQGLAMHYMLLRERPAMAPWLQLLVKSSKSSDANTAGSTVTPMTIADSDVAGVILCVAMTGLPSTCVQSPLHRSLHQRMTDCLDIFKRVGADDVTASSSLLATLLLTEDETRVSNPMAAAADGHLFGMEMDEATRTGLLGGGKKKSQESGMDAELENPLAVSSADEARLMVERLAVLAIAEHDTAFRKFEGKVNEKSTSRSRRRKAGKDADLDGFDFRGEKKSSRETTAVVAVSDAASVSSSASKLQLKQPKNDTARIAKSTRQTSVPALMASNKDTGGRARHSNAPSRARTISGSRRQASDNSSWSMDGSANTFGSQMGSTSESNFDPFSTHSAATTESATSSRKMGNDFDSMTGGMSMDSGFGGSFGEDTMGRGHRHASSNGRALPSTAEVPKVLVNVALNEDLTCFYKLSKMSSCSVEGVVQVQVKTNNNGGTVPFALALRDPSGHIQAVQENKKVAEVASNIDKQDRSYNFSVSVPSSENFFPVMRYKCGNDLRPVPIRVQTRVRMEDVHWRVALQISSNPHNEDNLTDLTIVMGVPSAVRGDSLTTSPAGGVWNESKRSVIWCVSELGGGEKFQLQARFEVDPGAASDGEDPKFPVLVRCQCMYAQLSDVQVEVNDMPDVAPADLKMKLTRRFRLSHRERP
eukprot:Nitzschia sp. Nitz4//scaffold35_size145790//77385//79715//NITZ4_003030-RA/size145790-augustus-gene-0.135-mRNA-1//-1//CDS//3329549124//8695//frame0